jgi:hypothetical protein
MEVMMRIVSKNVILIKSAQMTIALGLLMNLAQAAKLESKIVLIDMKPLAGEIVLQNDGFQDDGSQAYLQSGFVAGEKAGVFVKVPANIDYFKIKSFRILIGSDDSLSAMASTQIYFQMGIAPPGYRSPEIPYQIENAAQVSPGFYWNDVAAVGADTKLKCARAGDTIGASLEFTHDGLPSVYRDVDGLQNPRGNVLFGIPDGWKFSQAYGLRGDWILRIVGEEVTAGECP